ncbi:MAG: hypothetical protein K1X88_29485 [Nannocystaceae bacterium]|nr:hypothetical protein [Nannocystaceae bacterium]
MPRRPSPRAWALALSLHAVLACSVTTTIGSTAEQSQASTTSEATSTAAVTSEPGSSSASGEGSGSGSDGGSSSSGSESSSSSGAGETDPSGGTPICMPFPFDSFCTGCAKQLCCHEYDVCAGDFECACFLGCLQYPEFPCMCPPHPLAGPLLDCTGVRCPAVCPHP